MLLPVAFSIYGDSLSLRLEFCGNIPPYRAAVDPVAADADRAPVDGNDAVRGGSERRRLPAPAAVAPRRVRVAETSARH